MAIFGRRRTSKKAAEEEKGSVKPTIAAKTEQSKYVHVPVHAAADSLNVIVLPAKPDMRQLVRDQMMGTDKTVAPKLKSSHTWSAGDVSIASILEQPFDLGRARKSTRHSSFNSSNRRPPFRTSTSFAKTRSPLSNTIVEEDLLESMDESPTESNSSSDDGLEMKNDNPRPVPKPHDPILTQSLPELASESLIETSESLKPNTTAKERPLDKVDSFLTMAVTYSSSPIISQSEREYAERSPAEVQELPSILQPNSPALPVQLNSPVIDVSVGAEEDDWFKENSRVSRAFKGAALEEAKSSIRKMQAIGDEPTTNLERHVGLPEEQSPATDSRGSSLELPQRSSRRSTISGSIHSNKSSVGRSEQEYIARQANAYNTVLGHLYPEGKSVASLPDSTRHLHQSQRLAQQFQPYNSPRRGSVSPEQNHQQWNHPVQKADTMGAWNEMQYNQQRGGQTLDMQAYSAGSHSQKIERRSHSSQRRVSESLYGSTFDGMVHVSRYPSSRRASICATSPTYNEWKSHYEQDYFPPQQAVQPYPSEPPPIPFASKPRFVPTYIQPLSPRRTSLQRHHTMDTYSQTTQSSEPPYNNYTNNHISFTRHESYDSYTRASYVHDNRRSTAIDDRIAIAHMDSSYRQSKMDLTLDDAESRNLSGKGHAHTESDGSLFPQPHQVDSARKLKQLLGSEYRQGGPNSPPVPLSERPMLPLQQQPESPMVTRLEYPPSPKALSRASSVASSSNGVKVLDMPRSTPRKKKSFLKLLRKRKSSGRLLVDAAN